MSETTQYVMSKKSDLTSIADAVRSLINSTDSMSLDSIKSKVNTAKANIDDAFSALQDKGVTVPSNGSVSDIASLIESIEAGGVAYGTFTVAEDISGTSITITHNLGATPTFYCAFRMNATGSTYAGNYGFLACYCNTEGLHMIGSVHSGSGPIKSFSSTAYNINNNGWDANATTMRYLSYGVNGISLFAGESYFWIAGVSA